MNQLAFEQQDLEKMATNAKEAANFLKAAAHEKRFLILCKLTSGEQTVSQIEDYLSLHQPAVSQLLGKLREEGLVKTRQQGIHVYYSLTTPRTPKLINALCEIFCPECR